MINLLLAATLCSAGCNFGPGLSEKPAAQPPTKMAAASPDLASKPQDPVESKGQDPQATKQDKHRFVAERIFQVDKLQRTTIKLGKHEFHMWVMDTDAKRQEGMMFLVDSDFKDDEGMIFVFSSEDERRFWMHNTLVDLDISYCDKNGKIVKTYTMAKLDETTDYSSKGASMYVIEHKAGILKKLGISPGMKYEVPEDVVSKD